MATPCRLTDVLWNQRVRGIVGKDRRDTTSRRAVYRPSNCGFMRTLYEVSNDGGFYNSVARGFQARETRP